MSPALLSRTQGQTCRQKVPLFWAAVSHLSC